MKAKTRLERESTATNKSSIWKPKLDYLLGVLLKTFLHWGWCWTKYILRFSPNWVSVSFSYKCAKESNEKLKQSLTEYVLGAQRSLQQIHALSLERWILHDQELLHLYKQTFYRTVTEHYRQWANILKFHQALVPGDNCWLWHDLCNIFHVVISESKDFYQSFLIR